MPTMQELQQTVDAAFPQAAKVIRSDGSVFLTAYLVVTSPDTLMWTPAWGNVPWFTINVDVADVDWNSPSVDLGNGYKLNRNFDFSDFPDGRLALQEERTLLKEHWAQELRNIHEAEMVAA